MKLITIRPGLSAVRGAPARCCSRALQHIHRFRSGERNYRRLAEKGCGYIKINIGPFWRLLSRDSGRTWQLLTHERYNQAIRK
jgi:hypothetical protein